MPWVTPDLKSVRKMTRDFVTASLGAVAIIPNSVLRIMSDAMSGLGHLTLRYIDWLSRQFLPDTAETEWLDRHARIWLTNADGSIGRKAPAVASGSATMTGIEGTIVPVDTLLVSVSGIEYSTTVEATIGPTATAVTIVALDAGIAGNMELGDSLQFPVAISGLDSSATIVTMTGGTDEENDDDLRARVLFRIQQPPMGGDANDYVAWATEVAGVTRAWAAPLEMGVGTVTVRFMMDDLRSGQGGFPNAGDIVTVAANIDAKRPVAIKDRFIEAPVPEPIDFIITDLDNDTVAIRAAIEASVVAMLRVRAAPAHAVNGLVQSAQTIYAAWVSDAIMSVAGVNSFNLTMEDHVMPHNGALGVLGTISYDI